MDGAKNAFYSRRSLAYLNSLENQKIDKKNGKWRPTFLYSLVFRYRDEKSDRKKNGKHQFRSNIVEVEQE